MQLDMNVYKLMLEHLINGKRNEKNAQVIYRAVRY